MSILCLSSFKVFLIFSGDDINLWRIRVGSNYANSGGTVHITLRIINHPDFHTFYSYNDVALLHSASALTNDNVRPASIAGPNYIVPDNQPLLAVGWGKSSVSHFSTFNSDFHLNV